MTRYTLFIAALIAALAASAAFASPRCMSPAQLIYFLHVTGLPFEGVPGGVLVHAERGPVFYTLINGIYCTGGKDT